LRMGLFGTDGRGADAHPHRHRQSRQPAQRLNLLRALRVSLPDAHPLAENDAALARARVRAESVAGDGPLWPRLLGFLRQAPAALSVRHRYGDALAALLWQPSRPLPQPAACRRVDQVSRLPLAAGEDLPGAVGGAEEDMSARDAILGKIRRSLGVSGHDPG